MGLLGLIAILAITLGAKADDLPFAIHMFIFAAAAILAVIMIARNAHKPPATETEYLDGVVRAGAIATVFWGVIGFLVGLVVALQLAYPAWNPNLEWFNFGRLRPLHTSAVIFAFGGNALLCTSFYVVQRTCRARLALGNLAWFVFWGYHRDHRDAAHRQQPDDAGLLHRLQELRDVLGRAGCADPVVVRP